MPIHIMIMKMKSPSGSCNNHFGSIEADIWAVKEDIYVAHYEKDILPLRTLDSLYIQPIVRIFRQNKGKAWKDNLYFSTADRP